MVHNQTRRSRLKVLAIRICIVEDHREIREGLQALLEGTGDLLHAGSCGSMEDALPLVRAQRPNACLIDIGLPGMSGID